jgi:predicted nucleic acid-binding protein
LLDSLIAATALARGFTVATRNTRDFAGIEGILLLNPWEFPA